MTSASLPQGLASASTEYSATYLAYRAFDQNNVNFWRTTAVGKTPCNINYQFVLPQVIDKYTVTASTTTNCAPKDFKFQGRNGSTWTDLDTRTSQSFTSNEKKSYTFTNTTQYQEYRILVSANNGGTYTEIAEIEMMATIATKVRIPAVDLQTEITATKARISSLTLDAEICAPKVRMISFGLQVEVAEGVQTSRLKRYEDGSWVAHPLKRYEGGAWVEHPLKAYKDGGWI
jgi:hypothetical protein